MKKLSLVLLPALLGGYAFINPDKETKVVCEKKETGFVRIKSHPICIDSYDNEDKNTYRVHLTAGQRYRLNLCDANREGEKMVVFLLDKSDRELASNFLENGKVSDHLIFNCKQTGTYYLQFAFQRKAHGCGMAVLMMDTKRSH